MDRRHFLRAGLAPALLVVPVSLAGCGDDTKETGTVVRTPPEDLKSMEASAAAYKAMEKKPSKQ